MRCPANSRSTAALAIGLLTFSIVAMATEAAELPADSALASTSQLRVRVYSFPGLSPIVLQSAEIEADRLLRDGHIKFEWIDCTARTISAACGLDLTPQDLVVRVVARALPQASTNALGIAGSKNGDAIAFIFYDRMLALRTYVRPLQSIVGRVLAHEIVHMLLPDQGHAQLGLMRALWSADDLRPTSFACIGLPFASVQLMKQESLRRLVSAHNLALK
jgi:hypothetical protein